MTADLPPGTRLERDRGTRLGPGGLLVGGTPRRFVRLAPRGVELIEAWSAGSPLADDAAGRRLAGRLVDAGLFHPFPPTGAFRPAGVTVVVPVYDDAAGAERTVAAVGGRAVVVDDGSPLPLTGATARHPRPRGPSAARNTGWRLAGGEIVAFLDADCTPAPGWLEGLLPLFSDPRVGAVAPRIVTPPGPGLLGAYEAAHSPLDLGDHPAPVRPGSWVPYVPTAALVVRRRCLEEVGGFDETLRYGEDVDLVWRLTGAGWSVRYHPAVTVSHPARASWGAWLAQRYHYGYSAAGLAARHGPAVAPLQVSPPTAAAALAAGTGRPLAAAVTVAWGAARLLRDPAVAHVPRGILLREAAEAQERGLGAAVRVIRREWWPLAVGAAMVSRRARRTMVAVAVAPPLVDWVGRRPPADPLRWVAAHAADGLAYGAGVWAGCLAARSPAALLPRRRVIRTGDGQRDS